MNRWPTFAASLAMLAGLTLSSASEAQSYQGLFPERHLVCRSPRLERSPEAEAPTVASALVPLRRRPPPSTLEFAPLVGIDTAIAEPLPLRAPITPALPEPPPVRIAHAENDYRCLGFHRGGDGIVEVVEAPMGARFLRHTHAHSWRIDNLRALATHHDRRPLESLRRMLERPVPEQGHEVFEALDLRFQAARALGDLGDSAGAGALVRGLREREDRSYSLLWIATFEALDRMAPRAAEDYAASVVERVARGRAKPADEHAMRDEGLLREALPRLRTPNAARLAVLKGFPSADEDCDVLAARIRLGDAPLLGALRAELSTDLRTQRGAHCYSKLMPFAFPGDGPEEVPALLFRHRLESILHLIARARSAPPADARWGRALVELRRELALRRNDPDVAGDRSDVRHSPRKRALYLVALSALGDAGAARELDVLYRDAREDGAAPWLAALEAMRLELPGAVEGAVARLELAMVQSTRTFSSDPTENRGFVRVGPEARVVLALAERGDARFVFGLLAKDRDVREMAAVELGRLRPREACGLVARQAKNASPEAVQDAFWALSMLGPVCLTEARRIYTDASQPAHVRGMALELRAMLRDPSVASELASPPDDPFRPARERAAIIHAAPDRPNRTNAGDAPRVLPVAR
jgi:hypothetical protein